MMLRLFLVIGLALALPACGTKSSLIMPNGKPTPKGQVDPSLPPNPIER